MSKKIAVVMMSGGMDSALCAAVAKSNGFDIAALHLNYGQRTEAREQQAFNDLAEHYGAVAKLIVNVGYFSQIGGSSLTDSSIEIPDQSDDSRVPNTYVPFRNANIICIATSWAEVIGANALFIGAVEDDSSGYPDCRKTFFEAMQQTIDSGTKDDTNIKIITPIINFSKKEIVEESIRLNVPLHLTWSCYQNEDKACGVCDSCRLRLKGFQLAGKTDPIEYCD